MMNKSFIVFIFTVAALSCTPRRIIPAEKWTAQEDLKSICDSANVYKTLYISKISAKITLDQESYDARLSLYYIPDSLLFVSAVNSGFEIIRIAVMKDSTVYINRLDKLRFIYKNSTLGFQAPICFEDIQLLINKRKVCNSSIVASSDNAEWLILGSDQDIGKEIVYSKTGLALKRFEFFQKKSSEYVVGERRGEDEFVIYSNYIVDDLTLVTSGGTLEFDREVNVDLSVNVNKYETLYF